MSAGPGTSMGTSLGLPLRRGTMVEAEGACGWLGGPGLGCEGPWVPHLVWTPSWLSPQAQGLQGQYRSLTDRASGHPPWSELVSRMSNPTLSTRVRFQWKVLLL